MKDSEFLQFEFANVQIVVFNPITKCAMNKIDPKHEINVLNV
jgi:hypothetical protein